MNVYPLKCRIRAAAGATRVDVYDDIGAGGWFSGGVSAADFAAQLTPVSGPLEVHINSAGGDVFDGIAISSAIQAHAGRVTTVVDGLAASIASVIAQAGQDRVVQPGGMLMIHDAFGGITGNAAEMTAMAATLDKVSDNIASVYAGRSGRTQDQWRAAMRDETWYTADEAVAAGLADRVGDGAASLPDGLDLAALGSVPGRIAARLRALPQAAASTGGDEDGGGDSAPACQTCGGSGRLRHPVTGKRGKKCPGCDGTGNAPAAGDDNSGGDGDDGTFPGAAPPFKKGDRAGLAFRDAVMHGDHERVDPDGDGDCDACPEGDTDHDYWTAAGKPIKPLPAADGAAALSADDVRAIAREELHAAGGFLAAIPGDVKTQFLADLKKDTPVDIAAGMRRLSEWAATGHYPQGTVYADLKWFYDQCATELQARSPDSEAGGNFPPEPKGSAGQKIRDCHALVTALAAISEAAGGKNDHHDLSGMSPGQLRAALKGAGE